VSEGFVFARPRRDNSDLRVLWNADVVLLNASDATETTQLSTWQLLGDPSTKYGEGYYLGPYPLIDRCPDAALLLYDPLLNVVHRIQQGRVAASMALPPERRLEVTADRVFAILWMQMREDWSTAELPDSASMLRDVRGQFSEARHDVSGVFIEYAALHCAEGGVAWIQPFDEVNGYMGKGSRWLRVARDGSMREAHLPDRFRPYRFVDGRIWGVFRDELGVPSIAWIALS
jgi:hypothetical protein